MNAAVIGLASTLLVVVGGMVTAIVTRKPTPVEQQTSSTGEWEAITGGWKEQAAFLRTEVGALHATTKDLTAKVGTLEDKSRRDDAWMNLAVAYIRTILGWGHDAGAVDPPDPPAGLVIPDE